MAGLFAALHSSEGWKERETKLTSHSLEALNQTILGNQYNVVSQTVSLISSAVQKPYNRKLFNLFVTLGLKKEKNIYG